MDGQGVHSTVSQELSANNGQPTTACILVDAVADVDFQLQ
jgi:hypothetical protein